MADYPFLNNITNILVEIGYNSKLAEDGNSLLITELPLCIAQVDGNGKKKPPKIPVSGQIECLRFLTLCGFTFAGIDLDAKTLNISEAQPLEVSYSNNPILLTGLKALLIADMGMTCTLSILDVIKDFPLSLQEKIAKGYGCYRKMGRERCQGDCQGIRIPLDETILNIGRDIETWLDLEVL